MEDKLFRIYKIRSSEITSNIEFRDTSFQQEIWSPSILRPYPAGFFRIKFFIWYIFKIFKIFKSDSYHVYLIRSEKKVIHHTFVFPAFFRFPFMNKEDLQIGDVWTDPLFRGKGIARIGIINVLCSFSNNDKVFWYIVEDTNKPSVKVAEKIGFELVGYGKRFSRLGSSLLGFYDFI